jgi:hypothetical protein
MTSRPASRKGRCLARLAVIAAAAITVPLGISGTASAAEAASPWDQLAKCESGGNWKINTGNGYYGGLQFNAKTWRAHGGQGMPHTASKDEQIKIAQKVLKTQGWHAWPACSRKLGLRG